MFKKLLIILMIAVVFPGTALKADEGMWLPYVLDDALFEEMQSLGFNLSREQLFSFTESSLKDAIVSIGGCTAEIISDQGLLLTNHHCGYGRVQSHSSVGNDLLRDGFWAASFEDELANPGMVARFLVSVEDVTAQVNEVLRDDMTEAQRNMAIRSKSQEMEKAAVEGTHYTATLRPMFAGNEFFMFVFETFTDVRLVGVPPSSIGEYGGDTDNWMWPRHTGDFTLFRVYSGPDGKPADYSTDNVPLKPRHHLPVSIKGIEEGDFAMILGYPGSTSRYLTSYGIAFNLDNMYPVRIDIRRRKLDIIEEAMAQNDENRIMYASRQAGIANYWKNFIGMNRALKRLKVADTKREQENQFMQWVNAHASRKAEYGDLMNEYEAIYSGMRQFNSQNYIYMEAMASGPANFSLAGAFNNLLELLEAKDKQEETAAMIARLRSGVDRTFRNYNARVEEKLWAAMFEEYYKRIPRENLPEVFQTIERKYKNDFNRYAADVYSKSIFASQEKLNAFLDKPSAKTLKKDLMFLAAQSVSQHFQQANSGLQEYSSRLARAERLYIKGLREMSPDGLFYPDANSTMRLTYGTVGGYYPADAVYYYPQTTLEGVMEKEDPTNHEFIVPAKLKLLYQDKDYGPYGEDGVMYVNFLSDNDITGGNSGSPVINGDGHLIGLAFDGNWEAMSGDILFEPKTQRTISVDIRYVLFVIEKYGNAKHLINEMTIVR
ncbi:MAG: S46 family peptidase [Bacteroides sp.]|jgi:hypothetical protein|nr:S46 family peptidase [Bacteroides sp.]